MITTPPSERDLHAYVDYALSEAERHQVEQYLQANPEVAARVQAWQRDAQVLRTTLQQSLQQPENPALDPVAIRQRLHRQSRRQWATAAVLLIAVSIGGVGGWQARQITQGSAGLPMTDALAAHRMFALQGFLPADYKVQQSNDMQGWIDGYFNQAERLPDLSGAGFRPVSGRLLTTDQGGAAMVLYENGQGQHISFYIRPPGPQNNLLPRGSRRDGDLQADYWSGPGYNYAMVGPADGPTTELLETGHNL
ncbi:anti-sigma factor family protein [Pseudomonas paraversuta]|uniref:anti-sigma factor family protein n=1 Tax=Pseudomonas paraversuta TaxID=2750624 RepID=UPI0019332197|nr:anti-sigma factor [Pseudomonas paraversuta]